LATPARAISSDIGVLAYHLAFDENLTLGFNSRLATVLGMSNLEVLGEKQGRSLGMIGNIPTQDFASFCRYLDDVFGGYDEAIGDDTREILRVGVVGAMNDALVREAAARGVDVYITGQMRNPAQAAVLETGIGIVAVGHRRSEEWGLRALAGVLRDRWSRLEVILPKRDTIL
jgi:putative NIF3 family GTP cyclohydrolase 1 type 2